VSVGKDLPAVRVLGHARFLLEAASVDVARRILQGRRAEETAAALLLSIASVRDAPDRMNPELRHTPDDETAGAQGRLEPGRLRETPGRRAF